MSHERIPIDGRRDGRDGDPSWTGLLRPVISLTPVEQQYPAIEDLYSPGRRDVSQRPEIVEPGDYEFWPVKLVKNTLSVDMGVGCYACSFCVAANQPQRAAVQGPPYRNIVSGKELFNLLLQTQAFTQTDIRLRFCNDTDATLIPVDELKDTVDLISSYDHDSGRNHPISLLTHRALSDSFISFVNEAQARGQRVIVTASVTPPHKNLLYSYPMEKQLETFFRINGPKVLNFSPLIEDTIDQVALLLTQGAIVPGTTVTFSQLNYYNTVPLERSGDITALPATVEQMSELAVLARANGLFTYNSNECSVAALEHRESYDFAEVNNNIPQIYARETSRNTHLQDQCGYCPNTTCKDHNHNVNTFFAHRVVAELHKLGFDGLNGISFYPGLVLIDTKSSRESGPITKSDTGYLTNKLRLKITDVNSIPRPVSETLSRWRSIGFMPVDALSNFAQKLHYAQPIGSDIKYRRPIPGHFHH